MDTLVLSPNRKVRTAIREMLEADGDLVVVARNTVEGLEAAKRRPFEVVILDRDLADSEFGEAYRASLTELGQDPLVLTAAPPESWGNEPVGVHARFLKSIRFRIVRAIRHIRKGKHHVDSTG